MQNTPIGVFGQIVWKHSSEDIEMFQTILRQAKIKVAADNQKSNKIRIVQCILGDRTSHKFRDLLIKYDPNSTPMPDEYPRLKTMNYTWRVDQSGNENKIWDINCNSLKRKLLWSRARFNDDLQFFKKVILPALN